MNRERGQIVGTKFGPQRLVFLTATDVEKSCGPQPTRKTKHQSPSPVTQSRCPAFLALLLFFKFTLSIPHSTPRRHDECLPKAPAEECCRQGRFNRELVEPQYPHRHDDEAMPSHTTRHISVQTQLSTRYTILWYISTLCRRLDDVVRGESLAFDRCVPNDVVAVKNTHCHVPRT